MQKRLSILLMMAIACAFTFAQAEATQTDSDPTPADCAAGNTIFEDDFSDPSSGWLRGNSSTGANWDYTDNDEYRVFVTRSEWLAWTNAPVSSSEIPDEFCLEADVKVHVSGSLSDDAEVGIVFAGNPLFGEDANFNAFNLDPVFGNYVITNIRRTENGLTFSDYVEFTQSDVILGPNNINHLLIIFTDGKARFFINDELVETLSVPSSGRVGVFTHSFDEPNVNGRFDDFKVTGL